MRKNIEILSKKIMDLQRSKKKKTRAQSFGSRPHLLFVAFWPFSHEILNFSRIREGLTLRR